MLNRLGQVRWGDVVASCQICNRPRDFDASRAMECARRKL